MPAPSFQEFSDKKVARAVAVNSFWGIAGRFAGLFIALGAVILTTRTLGPVKYGEYSTALAFFYLFNALADLGLYNILSRDIANPKKDPARLLGAAFILRSVGLLGSFLAGAAIFLVIPKYGQLSGLIVPVIVSYAALSLSQLFMAVFQKHLAVRRAAFIEVVGRGIQFLAIFLLWFEKINSAAYFLSALALGALIQFLITFRAARPFIAIRISATFNEAKAMLKESAPIALSLIFTLIYFRLDTVLLSLFKTQRDVGVYNLSYKLLEQLIFIPAMFVGVLTPILSRRFLESLDKFKELFYQASRVIAASAFLFLAAGWFLALPIVIFLGGRAFSSAQAPLQVLLLATTLIFFGTLLGTSVIILGRQKKAIPVYALAMVINVVGNLLTIPKFSYMGAAWITVLTELVVDAGLVFVLYKAGVVFKIPKFFRIAFSFLVLVLVLGVLSPKVIMALGVWSLVPFAIICPPLYISALLGLKAVSRKDLAFLLRGGDSF